MVGLLMKALVTCFKKSKFVYNIDTHFCSTSGYAVTLFFLQLQKCMKRHLIQTLDSNEVGPLLPDEKTTKFWLEILYVWILFYFSV